MTWLVAATTLAGDWAIGLFGDHHGLALAAISVAFAVVALLLFKWATPQRRLAAARDRLIGRLLEAALYQASLPVILRVQGRVLLANVRYLVLALPAVAVLVVPMVLVIPQLEARYGRRPLAVGESTLITVTLPADAEARLVTDTGLTIEAGPVRDAEQGVLVWRVRATGAGGRMVRLAGVGGPVELAVPVGLDGLPALTAARHRSVWRQMVFDPAGHVLPAGSAVIRMAVDLPRRELKIVGYAVPWIVAFSVIALAAGLWLRRPLRVEL